MDRTTAATDHYDRLLAAHYTWMLGGDIAAAARTQAGLLRDLGVLPESAGALAIDLGCGPGTQALALAELGYSPVVAVDTSRDLLDELSANAGDLSAIQPSHADLRDALSGHDRAAAVVCMGDTLTHLPGKDDVRALLRDAARVLVPGGQLVLSYRDLTSPLVGTGRFLPVRATEDRIMTCFLEYTDSETVMVHDLIHTRCGDKWTQEVSSYPKLRIGAAWLTRSCQEAGLAVRHDTTGPGGLRVVVAVRASG